MYKQCIWVPTPTQNSHKYSYHMLHERVAFAFITPLCALSSENRKLEITTTVLTTIIVSSCDNIHDIISILTKT